MAVAVAEHSLTDRQGELLALIADDLRPREIAEQLHFSEITVRRELNAVREFYGVSTLSGAVAKAIWKRDLVFLETGALVSARAVALAS